MDYFKKDKNIILSKPQCFNINETLDSGQCFRFLNLDTDDYIIIANKKELRVKEEKDKIIFFDTTEEEFEKIWIDYFDLQRDYKKLQDELSESDPILKRAIDYASGIRILNQDKWECLISFIISQNNRIPMIKQVIKNISEVYGEKINEYYAFPEKEKFIDLEETELMKCKTGFRAKYIIDASRKISNGEVNLEIADTLETDELRKNLMKINGVGPKVSDCVMLFSMKKLDAFPIDVWVKRVMQYFYFDNQDVSMKEIASFSKEKFGKVAGFAQQYLFHYARKEKIGAK